MLHPGVRLGPYEIAAPLGAGGMGKVYRARDVRLGREVAIKVLPEELAHDPERRRRFEQEARAAAALNHSNILALYDIGTEHIEPGQEVFFIVTELLEGCTLRQALESERLPSARIIDLAVQVAEGLAAAHSRGIVHRDVKPENLFLTTDGRAKILDFGLAKSAPSAGQSTGETTTQTGTSPHTVLGTAGYMAPEQVRGQPADHRTDIFAFGAVLYEMLAGRRAFVGNTGVDTMTAVLREPAAPIPSSAERPLPPSLLRIVDRCLEKSPAARFQSTTDLAFALKSLSSVDSNSLSLPAVPNATRSRWRRLLPWGLAAGWPLLAGAVLWHGLFRPPEPAARVYRLVVTPPPGQEIVTEADWEHFDLSPDGSRLVYAVRPNGGGPSTLYVRRFDQLEATTLAGADGGLRPLFSPDGLSIAYLASSDMVKAMPLDGGAPTTMWRNTSLGAVWRPSSLPPFSEIGFKSLVGGRYMLNSDETVRHPRLLPDGSVLFSIRKSNRGYEVAVQPERGGPGGPVRTLLEGMHPRYVAPGYLVFARASTLLAAPFDLQQLKVIGPPVRMIEGIRGDLTAGTSSFSVSADGSLAYLAGTVSKTSDARPLVWLDRRGAHETSQSLPEHRYETVRIAPDGRSVAVKIRDDETGLSNLWIGDLRRGTLARFTVTDTRSFRWTADARRVIYQKGDGTQWSRPADFSGAEEPLLPEQAPAWAAGVGLPAPNSNRWVFTRAGPNTGGQHTYLDIWFGAPPAPPRPWLQTPFVEQPVAFSPDGKWLAYTSTNSGRSELYLQPFPDRGAITQVSRDGAEGPFVWSGREILFRQIVGPSRSQIMAVTVDTKSALNVGIPNALFSVPTGFSFQDVSSDGQQFLFTRPAPDASPAASATEIRVIINWIEEVKARVQKGR